MIPRILTLGPNLQTTEYEDTRYTEPPCGTVSSGPTSKSFTYPTSYQKTEGYDIEDYHKLVKSGALIPHTPFHQVEYEGSCTPGIYTSYDSSSNCPEHQNTLWFSKGLYGVGPLDELYDSLMADTILADCGITIPDRQHLVQAAASRIYESGHDMLTFLAELRKTATMFRNVYQRLMNLVSGLTPAEIANLWLEGRYGWRTLVYDIQDLSKAINDFDEARSRYSERVGLTNRYTQSGTVVNSNGMITAASSMTVSVSIRGSVTADIMPPRFRLNLLATGWELVPFSFVVDWLYTVGNAISAMSFLTLQSDYSASSGYKVVIERTTNHTGGLSTTGSSYAVHSASSQEMVTLTARTPASVGIVPYLNLNVDLLKDLDLQALIRQALR